MPIDPARLHPPPVGLDACESCIYRTSGTPAICFACCSGRAAPVRQVGCRVCGQPLDGGCCPNTVCGFADRGFSRIYTISERSEEMWGAVYRYKYGEDRSWAAVLGRILVGYLEEHRQEMARFDVITTGAIYVGPRAIRLWDYLRLVLEAAGRAGPGWPFAPGLIAKSGPTGRFLGIGVEARREIAEGELRSLLSVPEPERVAGGRVLVVDDVYSEGFSLREMARALLHAGATEVAGLVFTRRKGG
ncbi:ComF family protein [Geodermatophilus sabuli]|uniref:Predicted amidophosphoribosyltransferases n=1 Tax=Geodermatophilus sabuli TaxID=1564158 RepID=A0A285E9N2_9ACTN|nr:phosphoribosyltransferase family protein [Geodermatophilus sabuli]MBB3082203.1 putative amidophosphoribosyltransferase [Geodermatophilus sabuli]SNX94924.1 Predicted amidophosphoribosyltransferases [Geodermatophilus sabuli]